MADWRPTRAAGRTIALILLLGTLGILLGRVDLIALAAPFAVGGTLLARGRPRSRPTVRLESRAGEGHRLAEGDRLTLELTVANPEPSAYDLALLRIPESDDVVVEPSERTVVVSVPPRAEVTVPLDGQVRRWGRHRVRPVLVRPVAAGGMLTGPAARSESVELRVHPRAERFRATDAMPNAAGVVGVHPSRRPGDGAELADIRRLVPGDRLRRIDWRTSLRTGEPHVVQTYADADAELAIVLDLLHDAGRDPSVLDLTVRVAVGVAEHYADRGDRVKLVEYGGHGRILRAGSGPRHRVLVNEWLLDVVSGERRFGPSELPSGRALVPDRALVVVLTPLLDRRTLTVLASMARSRLSVVAVDTLPPGLTASDAGRQGRWTETAFRLWMLERRNTLDRLVEHGVPVVRWEGAGSLDQVLRQLAARRVTR